MERLVDGTEEVPANEVATKLDDIMVHVLVCVASLAAEEKPSCPQATRASTVSQPSSQTVPHVPLLMETSSRPVVETPLGPSESRTAMLDISVGARPAELSRRYASLREGRKPAEILI